MARQIGDIILVGTIDDITFYEMEGRGYARHKSSLSGKRVKRDPKFQRTMESAGRFGRGNQLASKVYRSLPREQQVYALFKELKSIAILAIKEGKSEAEVLALLQQRVGKPRAVKKPAAVVAQAVGCFKAGHPKKIPRVFRVHGGRVKKVSGQSPKGKGLRRRMERLGTGQREYRQRE